MIPELEFEIRSGTIGGKFTTVEGLLVDFKKQVSIYRWLLVFYSKSCPAQIY